TVRRVVPSGARISPGWRIPTTVIGGASLRGAERERVAAAAAPRVDRADGDAHESMMREAMAGELQAQRKTSRCEHDGLDGCRRAAAERRRESRPRPDDQRVSAVRAQDGCVQVRL